MKNCIYSLICMEEPNFLKFQIEIEELFCKCVSYNCKNCELFIEIKEEIDLKKTLKEMISLKV